MTKEQLQKELKEKVKPGIKPSQLKRSKSADDVSPPTPLEKGGVYSELSELDSETKYPFTTLISQQEQLDELKKETTAKSDTIKLLRKKNDDLRSKLSDLQGKCDDLQKELTRNPPTPLLQDQLKQKQQEIEHLRKQGEDSAKQIESLRTQLEATNQNLTESNTKLEQSLTARVEAVKQFDKVYDK
jgi:predicted  nucleic acid-binding Zn-ribbon protein